MVNPAPAIKDPLNINELIKQAKEIKKRLKLERQQCKPKSSR